MTMTPRISHRLVFDCPPAIRGLRLCLAAVAIAACGGQSQDTDSGVTFTSSPTSTDSGTGTSETTETATDGQTETETESGSETESQTTDTLPRPCKSDLDCEDDPNGSICDQELGECVSVCTPGDVAPCYTGTPETEGVGICKAGEQTCNADGAWGVCLGEVLPSAEVCGNDIDENCSGEADEDADDDNDGWGACSGDCCDTVSGVCQDPELVNPGAYDVEGNNVDDNCNGEIDEPAVACGEGLASDASNPSDYARAMDICQVTEEEPEDPTERTWGLIGAAFSLADGTGTPASEARAIRTDFGEVLVPQRDINMTVLSSGHAAAFGQTKPSYAGFQPGKNHELSSPPPAEWLAANMGKLPNPEGCGEAVVNEANDPIMLKLRIRAPTNANSFSVKMNFFSAEYPEWVCSIYNDFFVALLDSGSPDNPEDTNIAIYDDGDVNWPVGVNLVRVADGLFTQCENGVVGCAPDIPESNYAGCSEAGSLAGTGFDDPDPSGCGQGKPVGGGTGWLTMRGNIVPGEIFEVRFAVWDAGGHIFDSLVMLDDFEWSVDAAEPGIEPPQ